MKHPKNTDKAEAKRLLDLYNMLANLFWSIPGLLPLTIYCYQFLSRECFLSFLTLTLLPLFFPRSFFDKMMALKSSSHYEKFGVGLVNKFSQNGGIVHRLVRKRFPEYKALSYHPASIKRLLTQTYGNEKFHFAAAVFFILVTIHALVVHLFGWAVALTVINIFYNFYPILFQQYVRIKLKRFMMKEKKQKAKIVTYNACQTFLHNLR